jgi:lipoprotein NlpI
VSLFLGQGSPAAVLKASESKDTREQLEKQCEAHFFIGQYALLRGDRAGAERAFKSGLATRILHFDEYRGARAELARLAR